MNTPTSFIPKHKSLTKTGGVVVMIALLTAILLPLHTFAAATLTGYWAFDESSGTTAVDGSGNGQDGINTGATISTDIPSTDFPNTHSLSFNGSDSGVDAPPQTVALAGDHSRTISLWFKTSYGSENQGIFDSGGIGHDAAMELYTVADGGANFNPPTNPGGIAIVMWDNDVYVPIGIDRVADNTWHLLSFTYDQATNQSTLYFDGVAEQAYLWDGNGWSSSAQTQPFTLTSTINTDANDVLIGQTRTGYFNQGTDYFAGNIDDVRIYDSAITPSQVSNLAAGSSDPTTPPPSGTSSSANDTSTTASSTPVTTTPGVPDTGLAPQNSFVPIAAIAAGIIMIGAVFGYRRYAAGRAK